MRLAWILVLGVWGCTPAQHPNAPTQAVAAPTQAMAAPTTTAPAAEDATEDENTALANDLSDTHGAAFNDATAASELLFKDGQSFTPANALRARELFQSCIRRVEDVKARRAEALRDVPILFIDLEYFAAQSRLGIILILNSRHEYDQADPELDVLLKAANNGIQLITTRLEQESLATRRDELHKLRSKFAGLAARAHLMMGSQSKRHGDEVEARTHWQTGLALAPADDEIRKALEAQLGQP